MIKKKVNPKNIKIDNKSIYLRTLIVDCLSYEKRGHVGAAMSIVEILRVLYKKYINKNAKFILSKGHGCLALYAVLFSQKKLLKKQLKSVGKFNSILGGHPEHDKVPGVEVSTGALGHGLPFAVGMAIASKIKKKNIKYYVLCGDGEINEGSNWEAMLSASKHKLNNLILLIDYNKLQSYGMTKDILNLEPLTEKLKSFNFYTINVNGHSIKEINRALEKSKKTIKAYSHHMSYCKGKRH